MPIRIGNETYVFNGSKDPIWVGPFGEPASEGQGICVQPFGHLALHVKQPMPQVCASVTIDTSPLCIQGTIQLASMGSNIFQDGSVIRAGGLQDLADRLTALEGKVPLTRQPMDTITKQVVHEKEVRLVRSVEIQVPPEPSITIIDSGAVWAIVSFLVLRNLYRWARDMYLLGAGLARAGK